MLSNVWKTKSPTSQTSVRRGAVLPKVADPIETIGPVWTCSFWRHFTGFHLLGWDLITWKITFERNVSIFGGCFFLMARDFTSQFQCPCGERNQHRSSRSCKNVLWTWLGHDHNFDDLMIWELPEKQFVCLVICQKWDVSKCESVVRSKLHSANGCAL